MPAGWFAYLVATISGMTDYSFSIPLDALKAMTKGPRDERFQAEKEVAAVARIGARDMMRAPWFQEFLLNAQMAKAQDLGPQLKKMGKATLDLQDGEKQHLWLTRPVGLDFWQLRQIVERDPVLKGIIQTRINQVQRFLRPSRERWRPGFQVRFKYEEHEPSPNERRYLRLMEEYVLNCGAVTDPRERRRLRRDDLWDWVFKHLYDSLSMDAAPIEIIPTAEGVTHGWIHVDGAAVFLVDPNDPLETENVPLIESAYNLHVPDPDQVTAVLATEGIVRAWYTHDDMIYRVRRPRTQINSLNYGQAEPEDLIQIVTGFLNALQLNLRGFTDNSLPRGLLLMFGAFNPADVEELKARWEAQVQGVHNFWRLPMIVGDDSPNPTGAQFIPIGNDFNEMYFSRWMTFLVAIKAMLYAMDPEEINFESFTNRPSSLSGSDTEERLASSKDKGLWPLMQYLGKTINELLATVDPRLEFVWTGLESDQQLSKQDESAMLTLGEFRKRRGEAVPEDEVMANAPMNPAFMGLYMQQLQAKQQESMGQMMPGQGMPGPGNMPDTDEQGNRVLPDAEGQMYGVEPGKQPQPQQGKPQFKQPPLELDQESP